MELIYENKDVDNIVKVSHDELWKGIIEDLFEDFVLFFLPELYEIIDFTKPYEFLDKELSKISIKAKIGKKIPDKLVKVYLKTGEEKWVLIHIEIQGYQDTLFLERMFKYFYRIYDKYAKEIVALTIFTDSNIKYKPNEFKYNFLNTSVSYKFNIYKIIDQRIETLEANNNSFALIVLAVLYSINNNTDEEKYIFKLRLIRQLLRNNYTREKIEKIFIFINAIISLSDEMEIQLDNELINLEEGDVNSMGLACYKSNIAKAIYKDGLAKGKEEGIEKGIEKGMIEAKIDCLVKLLSIKKIDLTKELLDQIKLKNNLVLVDTLIESIFQIESIDDIKKVLHD